jgi:pyruvate/oxaloacetate carboxyltransferase/biotin carboxyl carrier protein
MMSFDTHGELQMAEMGYGVKRPKASNPVKVQDLSLRDGHQSLFATRGRTEDMLAVAADLDKVGFHSMEVWGGATFDTTHRYLNEDPWERLRTLKKHIKKTPFSMLLRGQNLVGYRNYPDDVVEAFVQRACDNGIDIFRVFDALNDFRNFQTAVKIIKKNSRHFQGTICYTLTEPRLGGEVYNLEYYLGKAGDLEQMGADSICIKDMAGLISPYDAYNLIRALKKQTTVPIHLHSHFTSGMADLAMLKAVEAGVDIIDTCLSPYAYRSSHPAIEPLVVTLLGTNRDTGFDIELLVRIVAEMEKHIPKYLHYANQTRFGIIDTNVILHQTPGGMLSNLVNQLRDMGELDKLEAVFHALPKVRKDLGQVPLVTPTSQIVGIQTVNNVLFDKEGEKFSRITQQVKDLCFGLYGKTPRPIDKKVQKKAIADHPRGDKPISGRPGEVLEPELETARKHAGDLAKNLDDLLIYALFPVTGKRFLMWKYGLAEPPKETQPKTIDQVEKEQVLVKKALAGELVEQADTAAVGPGAASGSGLVTGPGSITGQPAGRVFEVLVNGEPFQVEVRDTGRGGPAATAVPLVRPAGTAAPAVPAASATPGQSAAPTPAPTASGQPGAQALGAGEQAVTAPMPGMIVEIVKKKGDGVKAGEALCIIEAMKMNNNIEAPCDGVIKDFHCKQGDSVAKGDLLCIVEKR